MPALWMLILALLLALLGYLVVGAATMACDPAESGARG